MKLISNFDFFNVEINYIFLKENNIFLHENNVKFKIKNNFINILKIFFIKMAVKKIFKQMKNK